jgi:FAD/FMN-containing dehydrogenase
VIRDELNLYLKEHGLFFDPILTSNRCMIGGMVGNNCLVPHRYGVTRDKIEIKAVLSDGAQQYLKK